MIRLQRLGRRNSPYYRVIVTDRRNKRQGKYLENLGHYGPGLKNEEKLRVDVERLKHWLSVGAQVSEALEHLLKQQKMDLKTLGAPVQAAPAPAPAAAAASAEATPPPQT